MQCTFIALTGGPGAGKTAVLEAARQIFGHSLAILPEAASIVYAGGFPRRGTPANIRAAQRVIASVQTELEQLTLDEGTATVALCDRAMADGAAYWPDGPDAFYENIGLTRAEVFARYSTVIHLHTPSASMGYDQSNPMRTESADEAALLDKRIQAIWAGHPNRIVVPAMETFTEKLEQVTSLIRAELHRVNFAKARLPAATNPELLN